MSITYRTEYAVTFNGQVMVGMAMARKADALAYIDQAVAAGQSRPDYGVAHRTVALGPWALTTLPLPDAEKGAQA